MRTLQVFFSQLATFLSEFITISIIYFDLGVSNVNLPLSVQEVKYKEIVSDNRYNFTCFVDNKFKFVALVFTLRMLKFLRVKRRV